MMQIVVGIERQLVGIERPFGLPRRGGECLGICTANVPEGWAARAQPASEEAVRRKERREPMSNQRSHTRFLPSRRRQPAAEFMGGSDTRLSTNECTVLVLSVECRCRRQEACETRIASCAAHTDTCPATLTRMRRSPRTKCRCYPVSQDAGLHQLTQRSGLLAFRRFVAVDIEPLRS